MNLWIGPIEGSGILLIWSGRPIMVNSALERLRQRKLNANHLEWLCEQGGIRTLGEGYKELGVICIDGGEQKRIL